MSNIPRVQTGDRLTGSLMNKIIDAANEATRTDLSFTVPKRAGGCRIALAAIQWDWSRVAGVYQTTASLVNTATGEVSDSVVAVYAPNGTGAGEAGTVERRWIFLNAGRWELLEKEASEPHLPQATATIYSDVAGTIDAAGGLHIVLTNATEIKYYTY